VDVDVDVDVDVEVEGEGDAAASLDALAAGGAAAPFAGNKRTGGGALSTAKNNGF